MFDCTYNCLAFLQTTVFSLGNKELIRDDSFYTSIIFFVLTGKAPANPVCKSDTPKQNPGFSVEIKYGMLTERLREWNNTPGTRIGASKEIIEWKKGPKDLTETNENLGQHLHIAQTRSVSGQNSD